MVPSNAKQIPEDELDGSSQTARSPRHRMHGVLPLKAKPPLPTSGVLYLDRSPVSLHFNTLGHKVGCVGIKLLPTRLAVLGASPNWINRGMTIKDCLYYL